MKSSFKVTTYLFLVVGALLFSSKAQAQFQANLMGNYLALTESGSSFSDGLWGGGATLRYFIKPNLAVGLNGRYFTTSNSANFAIDPGAGVNGSVKASGNILMVTGQAEYFFSTSALRPYVGLEAGLYRAAATFEITNGYQTFKASNSANNFGTAPKVGLQYALSPSLGLNADAGYHLIFGDGETGKWLLLGAGVYFTFGQK
ncbi:outer membrane beta-barrel protein [Spirosoma oryzicola]|uniref:outer membrane beta-barrel protein n=1 Tax=Spirosoma oryzicola TaxID=2898794 RepID=UPI001E2854EC|nr:OmpW family outer membrane protein [Spirosoma oryzicola]UHG89796.1 outer membrane beta-barrel protein [Spirosoma oryzicola]